MSNPNYPDPCTYCSLMYLNNKSFDCRKNCEELKEAAKQWSGKAGAIKPKTAFANMEKE